MKQLQRLLAAAVLLSALSFNAAAGDGIIQTGSPTPSSSGQSVDAEEPAADETTAGDEAVTLDEMAELALICLRGTLALF